MSDESMLGKTHIVETFRAEGPVRSYKGRTTDGRYVSVKVVETTESDAADALERLHTIAALQAPVLAAILETGHTDDGYYVVREWVEGTHLGTSPLPPTLTREKLASAVADALDGVAAVNAQGLAHGDIRPSNIVVTPEGATKLVDALIPAAPLGAGQDPPKTAYYTSPEEIAGDKPKAAADIYRAGLVLYEALAGKPPFAGVDAEAVLDAHRNQTPLAPSTFVPESPKGLDPVVVRSLGKTPDQRYASAADMAAAIRGALASKKIPVWVWIAGAAVILLGLLGAFAASQGGPSGALLLLGCQSQVAVPQIVGMQQDAAVGALQQAGFKAGAVGQVETLTVAPGTVTTQTPAAGALAPSGSAVAFSIAVTSKVTVPNVTGQTQEAATTQLAEAGLRAEPISYVNDSKAKPGFVMQQNPAAAAEVTVGIPVALTVSKGPKQGQVPNVVGLSESDAMSTLEAAGYAGKSTKATSADVAAGNVISQSPAAGTVIEAGTSVTITVSKGAPAAPTVAVPNVVGLGVLDAVTQLNDAGLKVGFTFVADDKNVLKISAQDPAAATQVDPGSKVTISIGLPSFLLAQPAPEPLPAPSPAPTSSTAPAPSPTPTPTTPTSPTVPGTTTP
jgi:eukaryotic-like serine/threonine-protein kinase